MIQWSLRWYNCSFVSGSHFLCFQNTGAQGCLINIYIYSFEGIVQRGGSPVVSGGRTRGSGHKLKCRRFPLNSRKQFVNCERDQSVAKVAQRDGGVSILANMKTLSGHGLGEHDLGVPARAWVLDWVTSRGVCKLQPSCDSGILFLWCTVISVCHKEEPI